MDSNIIIAFAVNFVVGPVICVLLMRLPARPLIILGMGVGMAAAIFAADRLTEQNGLGAFLPLALLWLAWILGVSMMALALRRRFSAPRHRRRITLIAILATTLPWFGLATALTLI